MLGRSHSPGDADLAAVERVRVRLFASIAADSRQTNPAGRLLKVVVRLLAGLGRRRRRR